MKGYPFTILDIAGILNLKVRRRQPTNMDVDCPFCGHKKGKMNINFPKNVFRAAILFLRFLDLQHHVQPPDRS